MRKLWRLPLLLTATCCIQLTTIEISLGKRSVKSIWSCVNSENDVKTISRLATKLPRSVFARNYRYFSYK